MTAFGSESRGLRAFIAAVWLSCIGVLLPLPWELAQRAEQALDKTYAAETELARQAGKPTPTEPSARDRLIVTVAGWIEWVWSVTVILGGLIVSTKGKLTLTKWATWTVILGALFLLSRVVFEHIVYWSVISRRYERGPMILTSNQSFAAWGEVFGDRVIATAILDRLLHHAVTLNIRGNSYRLKEKLKAGLVRTEETES